MKNYTNSINKKTLLIYIGIVVMMAALFIRMCGLIFSETYRQTAESQRQYTLTVTEGRGQIYDRELRTLIVGEEGWLTAVFPTPSNGAALLGAVEKERRTAAAELLESGKPFVIRTEKAVEAPLLYSFSIGERYQKEQTAAHLIGYLDYEKRGITGIELGYQDFLAANGERIAVTGELNALQQPIAGLPPEVKREGTPKAGVVLTIDREIQALIERIGGEMLEKGAIVVMDPFTGELIGSASFPTFSPLMLEQAVTDEANSPMLNRALCPYSVGSTFKVVTAAAAMEEMGMAYCLERKFDCTGVLDIYGQYFRCHDRGGHGELDLYDALQESCNPWFISLGQEVGGGALLAMTKAFGFGQAETLGGGIRMQGGSIPTDQEMENPAAAANLSFGQGALTASPIQIARMMSVIVNGGRLVEPRVVIGTTVDGQQIDREATGVMEPVISSETALQLQRMLAYAVMSDDSQKARPGTVTAGGKTATAQTGQFDEKGEELEHGWFAGFFPAVNPRYVVVVLAENEGFGNETAAPVFAAVADGITALANGEK